MSRIHHQMGRVESRPRSVTLFSAAGAWATPFGGGLTSRSLREPWLARAIRGVNAALEHTVDALLTWHERGKMRRQLLTLDDRLLRDIGITRLDAQNEADKPFWRV